MNKMIIIVIVAVVAIAGVLMLTSNSMKSKDDNKMENSQTNMDNSNGVMVGGALMTPDKDIVENAMNADNVTTVVAAVKAAGLVATLQSEGPFTVFAPTNAAFEKLPAGTVDTLLMPENKAKLTSILTYHVVPGRYRIADLTDGQTLTSVQGEMLTVKKTGDTVTINGVMIETPDVISSNGVTHIVDSVLMPPTMQ